jgi:chitinase
MKLDRFVSACVQLMRDNGFDGLDIDWEYPTAEQMTTFTSLLEKLRQALDAQGQADGRRYLLTIAAPAGSYSMAGMDIPKIMPLLDWINLMTYDFYGSWSETTGFNAPLYTSPADPAHWSVDSAVQMYLSLGVSPEKLILGVPFYGRGWQGVKDVNQGLFQPFNKQPEANSGDSFTYIQLKQVYIDKLSRFWDDIAKAPWLFDASKGLMISYDDPQSLGFKAEYARQQNLGGMMIWEITSDDEDGSLLTAIQAALKE